jgi:hypothetical protein
MSAGIVAVVFEDNFSEEVLTQLIFECFFRKKFLFLHRRFSKTSAISSSFNEKIQYMNTILTETEQNIIKPYVFQLYDKAKEEGIQEGIEKVKVETILAAYRKGLTLELISEIVNLPLEKVKAVIQQQ